MLLALIIWQSLQEKEEKNCHTCDNFIILNYNVKCYIFPFFIYFTWEISLDITYAFYIYSTKPVKKKHVNICFESESLLGV